MSELTLMQIAQAQPHADPALQILVNVIAITVFSFGWIVLMGGLLVLVAAVAPNITHRAGYCLRNRGLPSFLLGLGAMVVLFIGTIAGHHAPPLALLVVTVGTVAFILAMGTASEALGRKLAILAGRDGNRVSHLIWGWLAFSLASGVPLVGWFIVFPYGLISGLGASILGFFVREEL